MWRNVAVAAFLVQGAVAEAPSELDRKAQASQTQRNLRAEERIFDEAAALLGAGLLEAYGTSAVSVCRFYSSIGRRDKADSLFQLSLAASRREKLPAAVAALLAWKGRDSMQQGRFDEAASELQSALSIAEKEGVGKLGDLLADLSQVELRLGHVEKAKELLLRKGSLPAERRMRGLCETSCPCDPEMSGPEPAPPAWLLGYFHGQGRPDQEEEILRLLVEESGGLPMDYRFGKLERLKEFLTWPHRRYEEADEIRRTQIAVMLSSVSPGRGECLEELIEPRVVRYGQPKDSTPNDLIRKEIASSGQPVGGTDIEYIRNVEPRVEAAIEKADYAVAERVLNELREAAVRSGNKRTEFLVWRSRRALVEACEQAAKFDRARTLIDRQIADAQAWFGQGNYYYASALSLRLDLAMKQQDYSTANALLPGFIDLAGQLREPNFERMGREWSAQLPAGTAQGNPLKPAE